jgi:regulator of CtrA degradation
MGMIGRAHVLARGLQRVGQVVRTGTVGSLVGRAGLSEFAFFEAADIEAAGHRADAVQDFAQSALFDRTFKDGMALVEAAASYLDGAGRQESRLLSRSGALAYANVSMRLTTQLMQVASWLLVQRAVREGDMAAVEACDDRYRVSAPPEVDPTGEIDGETFELPAGLIDLLNRSRQLYERVRHLDQRMYRDAAIPDPRPVQSQIERLRAAFGG